MWIINDGDYEFESLEGLIKWYENHVSNENQFRPLIVNQAYWWSSGDVFCHATSEGLDSLNSRLDDIYEEEYEFRRDDGGRRNDDGSWSW